MSVRGSFGALCQYRPGWVYFGMEMYHFGVYSEHNAKRGKRELLHFLASRAEGNIVISYIWSTVSVQTRMSVFWIGNVSSLDVF